MYFGDQDHEDQIGLLEGVRSRFGRTYAGEPDRIAAELAADEAVRVADTVLFTVRTSSGWTTTPASSPRSPATSRPPSAGPRRMPPPRRDPVLTVPLLRLLPRSRAGPGCLT
jgi:hypothetical protein